MKSKNMQNQITAVEVSETWSLKGESSIKLKLK